jgi:SAM-dependent methyltransferase
VDLIDQYRRQSRWRAWPDAYEALPPLTGARVLDLGCAIGDQAAELSRRGAEVVGIDANAQLLAVAQARQIPGARFMAGDIRAPQVEGSFYGIWASFVAAYFPDLPTVLAQWRELLRPGGWIALTEAAGMFDHAPLAAGARSLLDEYAREAFAAGRYDFGMGAKLSTHLVRAGFDLQSERILPDRELSFGGPADADVLDAWAGRLARMRLLQERAARDWPSLNEDFLQCLSLPSHTTRCTVHFCLAGRS